MTVALLSGATGAGRHATTAASSFFGDSLTDDGNLYALTSAAIGQGVPPAPYFEGRTSNGPVWADHIAADFAAKGLHYGELRLCLRPGGDQRRHPVPGGLQVPDLPAQIDAFKASGTSGLLGDRPVATLWVGSNDLFTAMQTAPASVPGAMAAAASAIAGGIEALARRGIDDFVVFNMVPVEKTPRFATLGTPQQAQRWPRSGSDAFNATLDGAAGRFRRRHADLEDRHPCGDGQADRQPGRLRGERREQPASSRPGAPPCDDPGERAFWDPVHPSTEFMPRSRIWCAPRSRRSRCRRRLLLLAGMAALAAVGARRRRG